MNSKILAWLFVAAAVLSGGCAGSALQQKEFRTLAFMCINDFHGAIAPVSLKTREAPGVPSKGYEAGGADVLAGHVKMLRSMYGRDFYVLTAGDDFQGTIEGILTEGAAVVAFYNQIGVNAAAVGNHEFDFGAPLDHGPFSDDPVGTLKRRMTEAHYPYVGANIRDASTGKLWDAPNFQGRLLLSSGEPGSPRVGVIGLATEETPLTTRASSVKHLRFASMSETTLREAAVLRKEGASAIVLLAHAGVDEVTKLLQTLPPGTVDAVISAHTHKLFTQEIAGVPVVQAGSYGRYYNILYFDFDRTTGTFEPGRTRMEGPVPICRQHFANQGNCDGNQPAPEQGRGELVSARFHGEKIEPSVETALTMKPFLDLAERQKKRVVGYTDRPLEFSFDKESVLGKMIADVVRKRAKADVALLNAGGIRGSIEEGDITFEAVIRTLPFDNDVVVMKVTGSELKLVLQEASLNAPIIMV